MSATPLRVCMVATYDLAEEGGVKKHTMHLASRLRAGGDHVDVVGPYSGKEPLPDGTHGFSGVVNVRANGSDNYLALLASPLEVRRFLRRGGYDVLHVMAPEVPPLAWYFAWFAGKSARVATFHAYTEREGLASRLGRRLFCAPQLRLFDRGIAVSPSAAEFARGAWPRPLTLIPNGVDTQRFTPAGRAREPGPLRILFVGHWRDPRKGLPVLLGAYEKLRATGAGATLDVIGAGPDAARAALPGLTYHGAVSDEEELARHYRDCDVFVAPSMGMESFGIVLLEAMAAGKPVVCSDIEGYRAVVPADGARLVRPGDAAGLAEALGELLPSEELRRRLGEVNRQASLIYDWSRLAGRVREEYLAALESRGGVTRRQRSASRARSSVNA
jgi:phosphatidyl-myo-inositol alpha-mannosyltransferase